MNINYNYIKYAIAIIIAILLQKTFIWLISLSNINITPDIVLIVVVYISIKEGKITGTIAGFIAGILIDFISGSFLGLLALCYTVAGFVAGHFKTETGRYLEKLNFLIIVFLSAFVANILNYFIFFQGTVLTLPEIFTKFVLTSSAYTTVVSIIYILFPKRKSGSEGYSS